VASGEAELYAFLAKAVNNSVSLLAVPATEVCVERSAHYRDPTETVKHFLKDFFHLGPPCRQATENQALTTDTRANRRLPTW
jgi:hypothetical protein